MGGAKSSRLKSSETPKAKKPKIDVVGTTAAELAALNRQEHSWPYYQDEQAKKKTDLYREYWQNYCTIKGMHWE
jgi:hypothetical protein